jgi:hypothetical protein
LANSARTKNELIEDRPARRTSRFNNSRKMRMSGNGARFNEAQTAIDCPVEALDILKNS